MTVNLAAIGNVTVSPRSMSTSRGAGRVKQRRLHKQHEGSVGVKLSLGSDNLFQGSSQMDGCGAKTLLCGPRNGRTQSIVDLERAGSVTETFKLAAICCRQRNPCDAKELAWSDVGENYICFRQLNDFVAGFNSAAKGSEVMSQDISERLRTFADNGPAVTMTRSHQ